MSADAEEIVVDPQPAGNTAKGKRGRQAVRWLACLLGFYIVFLGAITVSNILGPDRWWGGSLNLYLPQWLWGIPALILLAASIVIAPRRLGMHLICLACLIWDAVPLMGLCWGGSAHSASGDVQLRVMTYNIKYGRRNLGAVISEIRQANPDVLLIQDAGDSLTHELGPFLKDWNLRSFGQYIIASHHPLSTSEVKWISFPGEKHTCLKSRLQVGSKEISLYSAHFLTPREGLSAVKNDADGGLDALMKNTADRLREAELLSQAISEEKGPVVLAGDLNAPEQSLVCRMLKGAGLHDCFSEAGRGYGYTYGHMLRFGHSFMRIDHLMLSSHLQTLNCWTGGTEGSDHRPVIADILLKK